MATIYAGGLDAPGIVARARAKEGKANRVGYCLYHQLVDIFKVPGVGDYDHDGDADCNDYWKAAKKRGTVVETTNPKDIPAGALLIWSGHYGHAATYLGAAKILSTDAPRGRYGIVGMDYPHTAWGHTLLGYVVKDGNGFTLLRPQAPKPTKPKPLRYQVDVPEGVNVRDAPSTRTGTVVDVLAAGTKVTADKVVVAESRHWVSRVVSGQRQYMARELFKRI